MHEVEKPTGGSSMTRAKFAEIIYTIIELAQRKNKQSGARPTLIRKSVPRLIKLPGVYLIFRG